MGKDVLLKIKKEKKEKKIHGKESVIICKLKRRKGKEG
jgi:hypothetical protein